MGYRVRIVELAKDELKALPARSSARILHAVEAQLVAQPGVETRNRKRRRCGSLQKPSPRIFTTHEEAGRLIGNTNCLFHEPSSWNHRPHRRRRS